MIPSQFRQATAIGGIDSRISTQVLDASGGLPRYHESLGGNAPVW
jgi:hypothetical protein